jgi:hypothetical protein
VQTRARTQSLNAYQDWKLSQEGGPLGEDFGKELVTSEQQAAQSFHTGAATRAPATGGGSSPASGLAWLESKKKSVENEYEHRLASSERSTNDALQEYEQFIHMTPKNRRRADPVAGLKSHGARTTQLNALDDWKDTEEGGRFGSKFGRQERLERQRDAAGYGRETQVQHISKRFEGYPAARPLHNVGWIVSKREKALGGLSGATSEAGDRALLADYNKFMDPKARAARTSALRQVPAKGVLQGQSWTYGVGVARGAAEDPYNHEALLKPDPAHPGKVMLTRDARERRVAYKRWERAHPTAAAEAWAASGAGLATLDASRDPPASPTHDMGAYNLLRAGVRV